MFIIISKKVVINMKILLVSNMYPSSDAPNFGVFVKNTEHILKDSGFDIDRIVMHKTHNKVLKLFKYIIYYLHIIIKSLYRKYDLIYVHYVSHNAIPMLTVRTFKKSIKIYSNVHGSDIMPKNSFSQRLQKYVRKLLIASDKVIAPSIYYKNLLCDKYGLDKGKVYVFPSGGVNDKIFYEVSDKAGLYAGLGLDERTRYIGYVGRIDNKKGWDVLLDAVRLLKEEGFLTDKKFIIVGSGGQEEIFTARVKEYKLEDDIIRFSMLPQHKLNEIYNCLELFCFPSMGESLGLVGLEAMACGIPVLGSKVGGLLDYIRDGENGILFEPGDSNMLKDKVLEYFNYKSEKKESMKQEAVKTSYKYRVDAISDTLLSIFRQ
jgi:glycosyltransferase involved in cell wall biosynthesis